METPILECTITTGEQIWCVKFPLLWLVNMVHSYQYNKHMTGKQEPIDFSHNFQDMKEYFTGYDFVLGIWKPHWWICSRLSHVQ
ncbi:hypothetical protein [Chakrabartyella piscis]|uniref:hypothetical protein n=1 Tax=Chakrabartyella piscis TaxID=2918914 RepID=UPI002958AD28|nr:hypothetical protein [Chakrabartyella piscis]